MSSTESPGERSPHTASQTVSLLGERSGVPQAPPPPDAARPPPAPGGLPRPGGITGDSAMAEKTTKRQGGLSEALQPAPALLPLGAEDLARVEGGGYYDDVADPTAPGRLETQNVLGGGQ